jgi:hypothetical protein
MEFEQGMPAYLNYEIKTSAQADYLSHAKTYTEFYGSKTKDGYSESSEVFPNYMRQSYSRLAFDREEIDLVLLFSDGVQSFVDSNTNKPVPFEQVLDVILDLPRMSGQFITRSCNYLLKKHCAEKGWVHHDDFSCAGIYMP